MLVSAAAVSTASAAISAASISTAATATVSTAAGAEFFLRSGFIDGDGLTVQHAAVKFLDGLCRAFFRFHFDKAESLGLTGKFVLNNRRGGDFSRFRKIRLQVFIRDLERQVADIQILVHFSSLSLYANHWHTLNLHSPVGFHKASSSPPSSS